MENLAVFLSIFTWRTWRKKGSIIKYYLMCWKLKYFSKVFVCFPLLLYPFWGLGGRSAGVYPSCIWAKEAYSPKRVTSSLQGPTWPFGGSLPCSMVPENKYIQIKYSIQSWINFTHPYINLRFPANHISNILHAENIVLGSPPIQQLMTACVPSVIERTKAWQQLHSSVALIPMTTAFSRLLQAEELCNRRNTPKKHYNF